MNSREDIKKILKEEALRIIQEGRYKGIEELVFDIYEFQKRGNEKRSEEIYGILFPRLAAVGFERRQLMQMKAELRTIDNEKEVIKFIAKWKLHGDELEEQFIHVYKIILSIPFTTTKNKDEKIKELKYFMASNGIKNLGYKELPISLISVAGSLGEAMNFKVLIKVKTKYSKSDLENIFQPKYKLEKVKEFKDG